MSAVAQDAIDSITAEVTRRWQAADPMLPAPGPLPAGCGAQLAVSGPDGQLTAVASCEHIELAPGSLDLAWSATHQFKLTPRIQGPDVEAGLDRLLTTWRAHLAEVSGQAGEDSAAVVEWPCRDVEGTAALLRHGLAPLGVVAARRAGRSAGRNAGRSAGGSAGRRAGRSAGRRAGRRDGRSGGADERRSLPEGVTIRRAGPADIEAVLRLGLEVIKFDAHFGGMSGRAGLDAALRPEAQAMLAGPQPWTWLAERDGRPVGMLAAQHPEAAGWIAPMVGLAPAAYNMLTYVASDERASGVGAAMAARLHHDADAAGVTVMLLHYEQPNPLSAPFWSQQRYRPVWTSWEARPAGALR
jgi:hypothetical protein